MIASPDNNSSVTAALKNAIDWISRPQDGCPPLDCFEHKVAGLVAASPGGLGGLRGLSTLRSILGNIRVTVLPRQVAVPKAHEALGEPGLVKPEAFHEQVMLLGKEVADMARRMHEPMS